MSLYHVSEWISKLMGGGTIVVLGVSHSDNLLSLTLLKVTVNQRKLGARQCLEQVIVHSEI